MKQPTIYSKLKPAALVIAVAMASGCSTYYDKKATDGYVDDMGRITRDQVERNFGGVTLDAKRAAQDVPLPYITGRAIPLAREVTLPAPLRGVVDMTMMFRDTGDLAVFASRIQDATGIPVKVTPDALLPVENFMPRLETGTGGGAAMTAQGSMRPATSPIALDSPLPGIGGAAMPMIPVLPAAAAPSRVAAGTMPTGIQPLATVLDHGALRHSVNWKYDDTIGAIVFYRTETRTFEIRGAEMAASSEMGVDLTGGVDAANSSGLSSKSKSSIDVQRPKDGPMEAMIARLTQFMTKSGRVAAGVGGLIVVTDTKTALDQIATFVKQENTQRSRRIDLVFEEITIEKSSSSNLGTNWNLMFNGNNGDAVNIGGLNSIIEQEGAALSIGATAGSGLWAGSSVAVQALSKVGRIVDQRVNSFGAVNGQPATSGRPQRQRYIDKLEQTASTSDVNQPTVTVTQAEEVSGRIISVLPYAYSDGDINLVVKFDNTPTPVFTKQTLPDGSYVQSPSSVSDVLVRTAMVHSGQPFVISATTVNNSTYNERRTDRAAPLLFGGSDVVDNTDRVTVFVLTAKVSEK